MSGVEVGPMQTVTSYPTFTKTVRHRWGSELGDVREYTIGAAGNSGWIRGHKTDISGPLELLQAVLDAIQSVLDEADAALDDEASP